MVVRISKDVAAEILRRRRLAALYMKEASLLSNKALADKFDMHVNTVSRIINHRWRPGLKGNYRGIVLDDARLIRSCVEDRNRLKALANEHSAAVLAAENGLTIDHIYQIHSGVRWQYLQTTPMPVKGVDY